MRITFLAASLLCVVSSLATDFGVAVQSAECARWVDSVYSSMSPRRRIAQLFCPVVDPSKGETSRAVIKRYVGQNDVGGLLFRKGSISDYVSMTNYAQSLADVPLMMTLDGEWGLSMRVPDTPRFPYNMALGAVSDTRLLRDYGAEVARECREMGVHVDFAPVADVNLNPANPVIGYRSFGEDPSRVASAVVAYSRGMEEGGVLTTAKHFPGHGDTSTDSHKTVPVVDHTRQFMADNDLLPFRRYIEAGLSGVMVGHLSVPSLDASGSAASMSHTIVTDLLKGEMGFKGLVFTDALEMKGAVGASDNNCVSAFMAGADMLLSSANPPADITAIQQAIDRGDIDPAEVERRCRKVLSYKWVLGLTSRPGRLDINGMRGRLNTPGAQSLIERLTAASVTVTGNARGTLPLSPGRSVAVVNIGAGPGNEFASVMKRHGDADVYSNASAPLTRAQLDAIESHDVVVAAVYDDKAASIKQLEALKGDNLVAVMFMNPYKALKFRLSLNRAAAMVMMYDNNSYTRRAAADAVWAGNAVSGRLPVTLPGVAALGEGMSYPATRMSFSTPATGGMAPWLTDSIDAIARPALAAGAFSGLQVLVVKDGHVVADRSYGRVSSVPGASAVTDATLFDLASMSKAVGTLPQVMRLVDEGELNLDAPLSQYIPELAGTDKADITPRMLLLHESGMPAGLNMNEVMMDPDSYTGTLTSRRQRVPYTIKVARNVYGNANARMRRDITSTRKTAQFPVEAAKGIWVGEPTRDTIMHRIYEVPLKSRTMRYSCLNFCLLMEIINRHGGLSDMPGTLGAPSLMYNPLGKFSADEIAATEKDNFLRRQTLHGYVHDELAAFSGTPQGNAGLFGNATDVAKVCMMYLNGGSYGGRRLLSADVVRMFTTERSGMSRRGLGFDRPDPADPDRSPVPEEVPASAYGHTGFTGTCFWVDPDNKLIYVFLSNRVNPSRDNRAWVKHKTRSRIHSLLYKAIDQAAEI